MRLIFSLLCGMYVFSLASCSTSKPLTSNLDPSEIQDMQVFHPVSHISLINKGNVSEGNDSLSRYSKILLLDILRNYGKNMPIGQEICPEDPYAQEALEEEIQSLFNEVIQKKNLNQVSIPPLVSHLLAENDKRFGILTVTNGFARRKGNYGGQILKSIGIGILTMGIYYPVPIKASSFVGVMIVDNHSHEVAFFRRSYLTDKDPLNKAGLSKQLEMIFQGYFEETHKSTSPT